VKRKPPGKDVRRVVCTGTNIRGVITNKVGRSVQFESWQERCLLLRFERDREIADYASQPEQFEFIDEEGRLRTYVPDFIVWRWNETIEIHEVTVERRRRRTGIRRREKAAEALGQLGDKSEKVVDGLLEIVGLEVIPDSDVILAHGSWKDHVKSAAYHSLGRLASPDTKDV
jgi:hypothetical protein